MKVYKGVIHDLFVDICVAVNRNVENDTKEHKAIHEAIKKSKEELYRRLGL